MKTILKKLSIALMICTVLAFSLVSCSSGIDKDEAKLFIEDFLEAVEAQDYEKAKTYLHPERPVDLGAFLEEVESQEEMDFQAGIELEKYTGFSSSYYNSDVDGSRYEVTIKAKVGGKNVEFTVEVVKNDKGYGIYNFVIDT